MPKIIKSKSAVKSNISKSVPKSVADSLFGTKIIKAAKAKPVTKPVAKVKALAKVTAKAKAVVAATTTPAERRAARAKLAKRLAAKEAKALIGANGKATRTPKLAVKTTAAQRRASKALGHINSLKHKKAALIGADKKAKVVTRKPRVAKVVEAVKPLKTRFTKASLILELAERSGADKNQAKLMFEGLSNIIAGSVAPRGLGTFTFPGLFKVMTKKVAARKGGAMVMNRFSGEMVKQKAKAASVRVKVRPLSALRTAALG